MKKNNIPAALQFRFETIVQLTDEFCKKHLHHEFAILARDAAAKLCRKRPSPLNQGEAAGWACGIVYAVGSVNFIFDKSQNYYMSAKNLCAGFGVSTATGAAKARLIQRALKITPLDPNWCLPSKLPDNPLAWMIMVNGFVVDARTAPLEIQQIAFEKGLIPYIP